MPSTHRFYVTHPRAASKCAPRLAPVIMTLMQTINVGIVGLGNIGTGTMTILAENADQIALKLGFDLRVKAVCDLAIATKQIPEALGPVIKTDNWREGVGHPDV